MHLNYKKCKVFRKSTDSMSKGFSSMRASFQPGILKLKIKKKCTGVNNGTLEIPA